MPINDKAALIQAFGESAEAGTFVKLTLGKCRATGEHPRQIFIRQVAVQGERRLSFLARYATKDITKIHDLPEALRLVGVLIGTIFHSAVLSTAQQDIHLEYNKRLETQLTYGKLRVREAAPLEHDREKIRLIKTEGNIYLRELGVTDEYGAVRQSQGGKYRQINKYIEILGETIAASALAEKKTLNVEDMGSGKGYLTFALYDYLHQTLGIDAHVTGVEGRADMVALCNRVADAAGFTKLHFVEGLIANHPIAAADIVVALHACDTATDDAIAKGIAAHAEIIVCAPCCHKEIRPQIIPPPALGGILAHGILLGRQAEILTDGLRALLLELHGYTTRVFEFISAEHTDKNVMIIGIKHSKAVDTASITSRIAAIRESFSIRHQHLEEELARIFPSA